jgi:ketosteroid isomerase-like protein
MKHLSLAREYLAALENGEPGAALRRFFTPDFVQIEYPNALNPRGQRSNVDEMVVRCDRGKEMLRSQRFRIENAVESDDSLALEVEWTGVVAVPVAGLPAGGEMRAHIGVFLDFRDGKIARQRNYDCFEPLS